MIATTNLIGTLREAHKRALARGDEKGAEALKALEARERAKQEDKSCPATR